MNLVYLAFIAFLPFPTLLVGRYERNPVSVVLFAVCLATVSGLEVAMFHRAWKAGHTKKAIPRTIFRFGIVASTAPVVVFMLSVPLAFLNPTAALLLWLLVIPIEMVIARRAPAGLHDSLRAQ